MLSPASAAYLGDLALGDPQWAWHPVRLMGRCIAWADTRLPHSRAAGLLLALGLPAAAGAIAWALLLLSGRQAWLMHAVLIFFCLAGADMIRHARAVLEALQKGDLPQARMLVGRIVGRDTDKLDEQGVLRACIESTAESFCDGFFAPLCFAFLGGAPWALAYKAVSTLDSMVGYKNAKYADFGWASARLDDLLNYVPARLSALAIAVAGASPQALAVAFRDAGRQPSPNSGWPEAAFAGALGIQLGGPCSYCGEPSNKELLGEAGRPIDLAAARSALRLFQRAAFLSVLAGELMCYFLKA